MGPLHPLLGTALVGERNRDLRREGCFARLARAAQRRSSTRVRVAEALRRTADRLEPPELPTAAPSA